MTILGTPLGILWLLLAGILFAIAVLMIFYEPSRIGKEREPFTASDYRWNLVIYIMILAFIVCGYILIVK